MYSKAKNVFDDGATALLVQLPGYQSLLRSAPRQYMRSRRGVRIVFSRRSIPLDSPNSSRSLALTCDNRVPRISRKHLALSTRQSLRPSSLGGEFGGSRIMPADAELSSLLSRRQRINDELEEGKEVKKQYKFVNVYTEFHELSRREIKQYEQTFNR